MSYNQLKAYCQLCSKAFAVSDPRYYVTRKRLAKEAEEAGWSLRPFLCPECRKELEND